MHESAILFDWWFRSKPKKNKKAYVDFRINFGMKLAILFSRSCSDIFETVHLVSWQRLKLNSTLQRRGIRSTIENS